ncbi:MAG TPA: hypothetical protein PKD70_00645 [Saprospiraceae bacterium]|nr:hypothetical protein [Saprospiraceae bacterium]HMP12353.1 hypothetical protein [Saprospiraceae bacterium]
MKQLLRFSFLLLALALLSQCTDLETASPDSAGTTGVGGSLAQFTIVGNFLYTVDASNLRTFDISKPDAPELRHSTKISSNDVETIFPLNNWLFLGTQSGMLIYQLSANGNPSFVSAYQHVVSCDPVVANKEFAYVTLRATGCRGAGFGAADRLDIISIANIRQPQIISSYFMREPYGLGVDGTTLFVCDGRYGVRVFNVANPSSIVEIAHLEGFTAYDVIPLRGLLLVIGPENIYQYDYTDLQNIRQISQIPFGV